MYLKLVHLSFDANLKFAGDEGRDGPGQLELQLVGMCCCSGRFIHWRSFKGIWNWQPTLERNLGPRRTGRIAISAAHLVISGPRIRQFRRPIHRLTRWISWKHSADSGCCQTSEFDQKAKGGGCPSHQRLPPAAGGR